MKINNNTGLIMNNENVVLRDCEENHFGKPGIEHGFHPHKEHPPIPPIGMGHPHPPGRRNDLRLEFDGEDVELFKKILGDEDSALAVMQIITQSPPEMQVIIYQIVNYMKEVEVWE